MPKKVFKLEGFHRGITGKWAGEVDNVAAQDDMDAKGILQKAENVMVDSPGQIRPAGFWKDSSEAYSTNSYFINPATDYDIEEESGIPTNDFYYNSSNTADITGGLSTVNGLYKYTDKSSNLLDSIYEIKWSYVFNDGNESILHSLKSQNSTVYGDEISLDSSSFLDLIWWENADTYDNRKIRFYIRDINGNDQWYYLGTVGEATEYGVGQYGFIDIPNVDSIVGIRTGKNHPFWTLRIKELPPITYEAINGYKPDVDSLKLSSPTDVTFANHRVFALKDDTIVYSQPGKYASFPRYDDGSGNILNPAESNSTAVALESFGDRLIYFTDEDISYISIKGMPSQWSMTKTFKNQGVSKKYHTFATDIGVVWFNKRGCYYSSGSKPQDLSKNLNKTEWAEDFYTSGASIGYLPNDNQVLISENSGSGDEYCIFDFRTKSWTVGNVKLENGTVPNTDTDRIIVNEKLLSYAEGDTSTVYEWINSPYIDGSDVVQTSGNTITITTNKMDFGSTSIAKKVYKIYITYANYHESNKDIELDFRATQPDMSGNVQEFTTAAGTAKSALAKSEPDYNPVIKTLEYELTPVEVLWCWLTINYTAYVVIKDISIEYRALKAKRV